MTRNGQIHLFETKRDYDKIRESGVAGRALWDVKQAIEATALSRTGRRLRHPVEILYFSYVDERFDGGPHPLTVNIGSPSTPHLIPMPIYSREDMNNLIGPCFGEYLRGIDSEIARAISDAAPELRTRVQQAAEVSVLGDENAEPFLRIGELPREWDPALSDILE